MPEKKREPQRRKTDNKRRYISARGIVVNMAEFNQACDKFARGRGIKAYNPFEKQERANDENE